jgi:hypothetical protein
VKDLMSRSFNHRPELFQVEKKSIEQRLKNLMTCMVRSYWLAVALAVPAEDAANNAASETADYRFMSNPWPAC